MSAGTPRETSDAVVDGGLDAAVLAQPYAELARDRLGANAVVWPAQSAQLLYALVVSTGRWIAGHPKQIIRFILALAEAEKYVSAHPVAAKGIVQRRLGFDPEYMDVVWQQNQFTLSPRPVSHRCNGRRSPGMIENNMTNEKAVPNSAKSIYTDALKAVKPEAVNIIE